MTKLVSTSAETSTQRQEPTVTTKATTQSSTSTSALGPNAIPRTGSSSDSADGGLSGTDFFSHFLQHSSMQRTSTL